MNGKKVSWLSVILLAFVAAFLLVKHFFPQIMEQMAAGIVALGALLVGLLVRKKK